MTFWAEFTGIRLGTDETESSQATSIQAKDEMDAEQRLGEKCVIKGKIKLTRQTEWDRPGHRG
ncbi:MAG: hypothetical protein WCG80_19850 [Spirochaetales bacterium]